MYFFIYLSSLLFSTPDFDQDKPELVCVRNNKAKKLCYYNFQMNGGKYHYIDVGCKYTKAKVIEKVNEGTIALGKNWEVPC